MSDLKKLCLENDDLVHNAGNESVPELRYKLWNEINSELESEIPELGELLKPVPKELKNYSRRYYQLSKASSLEIGEEGGRIWFGVRCVKEKHRDSYAMLESGLEHMSGEKNEWYPWWRYADGNLNLRNPTEEHLKLLSNKEKRKEFVRKIVQDVKELLEALEDIAMVNAIKEGEKTELVSEEQIFKILTDVTQQR